MVTVGAEMVDPEGSSVQFMVGFKFIGVQPVVFRGECIPLISSSRVWARLWCVHRPPLDEITLRITPLKTNMTWEKSQCPIGNTSSNAGCSMVMLVFREYFSGLLG